MRRLLALIGCLAVFDVAAQAAGGCNDFRWDVSAERALFATASGAQIQAGKVASSAPDILVGELFEVALHPQESVQLAAPPSKAMLPDGLFSGLLRLRIPAAGRYRIAINERAWVDVVDAARVISSSEFSGVANCKRPAKVVVFDLPVSDAMWLQISAATSERVSVTVVPHSNDAN